MRCVCCNKNLNDYESTLKSLATGDFLDMCKKCLEGLDIKTMKNTHDPDISIEEEVSYYEFDEVELNPFNVEED